jgi:NAD+ synthase (glutamine-hydrolysing)
MNATVGDIAGNADRIREGMRAAGGAGADLVLFPELALTGYPPEDLLLREHFLADAGEALRELAADTRGVLAVVGFPERADGVYNAAAVLADGEVRAIYRKVHLPNYGVFDEQRYFRAGSEGAVIDIGERRVGLTVCEDMWVPGFPGADEALAGAGLIVNISASPYHAGKGREREEMFMQRARESSAAVAFCALVGGQDELVFDGQSCVIDRTGKTLARAAQFQEELLLCDLSLDAAAVEAAAAGGLLRTSPADSGPRPEPQVEVLSPLPAPAAEPASPVSDSLAELIEPIEAEVYSALILGLSDYVNKNGFEQVVLGVSGGIDSALVACLAADSLGAARVNAAIMPSRFSSSATQDDARALCAALGIRTHELPIEPGVGAYTEILSGEFRGRPADLTEENIQARIRGNLLMALSNKFGWLVLTTGNKSEMSVGYTTLYGDAAGGFAVIKDVPKTLVYRLCKWRNSPAGASPPVALAGSPIADSFLPAPIPPTILERAPSAELRHAQRDQDSLPPYELLDRILYGYIELDQGREQLIADGLPEAEVDHTIRLVDHAEYKRRQAPPGIKITTRAFGRDRRMPITNRYRG